MRKYCLLSFYYFFLSRADFKKKILIVLKCLYSASYIAFYGFIFLEENRVAMKLYNHNLTFVIPTFSKSMKL